MSEMSPEARPRPGRRGNVLTRKLGPLPTWAWVLIALGIMVAYAWWHNRNTQQAGPSDTTGAGQVPQFVSQTFVSPEPPEPPESGGGKSFPPNQPLPPPHIEPPPGEPPPGRTKHHKGQRPPPHEPPPHRRHRGRVHKRENVPPRG